MTEFTLKDLRRILEAGAGVSEEADWDSPTILQEPFNDIGYDSLAMLEFASRVQLEYGVPVPEGLMKTYGTPGAVLGHVNDSLSVR